VASRTKELPADAVAFKEQLQLPEMPEGVSLADEVLDKAIAYSLEKGYGPKELADFLAFDIQRASMEADAAKNEAFQTVGEAKKASLMPLVSRTTMSPSQMLVCLRNLGTSFGS
jgi:hypothetical protein